MCTLLKCFTQPFISTIWKSVFCLGPESTDVLEAELQIVTFFLPLGPHNLSALFDLHTGASGNSRAPPPRGTLYGLYTQLPVKCHL